MKRYIFFLLFSINCLFSQEKTSSNETIKGDLIIAVTENGKTENNIYSCYLFDWKIAIPAGYTITAQKRTEELEKKGYEALQSEVPKGLKINPHPTQLIGFELDKYNYFNCSFESLIGTQKMSLEEHKNFSEKLIKGTYSKIEQLKVELTTSDLKLGGHDFYKIQIRVYNALNDKLLIIQELYNSYIDNHLFSASINYTNENVGMVLNYNFTKSFEK